MSYIQYGSCTLNLVKVHEYRREAVYSGPHYLYTRHTMSVRAVLTPGTQADRYANSPVFPPGGGPVANEIPAALPPFRLPPAGQPLHTPPGGPPKFQLGNNPQQVPGVVSDQALRHDMMQPQQTLRYVVGGLEVLLSPMPGFPTDASNGPRPLSFNVIQILGPRTFLVDWAVQTDVNELPTRTPVGGLPVVLSQDWTMSHEMDENYFTKRVIQGRVVFRADALNWINANLRALGAGGANGIGAFTFPGSFRSQFFHPIPTGFKRESVHVKAEEDACTLAYTIVDRELPIGWNSDLVTKLEAFHTARLVRQNVEDVFMEDLFKHIDHIVSDFSREGYDLGKMRRTLKLRGAALVQRTSIALMPSMLHRVHLKIWGHARSTRNQLEQFGWGIVQQRIGAILNARLNAGHLANKFDSLAPTIAAKVATLAPVVCGRDILVTHDIAGKFVELEVTATTGPYLTTGLNANALVQNTNPLPVYFGTDDNTINAAEGVSLSTALSPGAGPVGDGVSRGSYLEQAIAQLLYGYNAPPVLPPPATPNAPAVNPAQRV